MKQYNRLKWTSALIVTGGLLWMVGGIVLALRPAGNPPHSFRATLDVMPLLGAGLLLVAGSLGLLALRRRGERPFQIAAVFCLAGALFYPMGILVRQNFLAGGWEPLMPVGFLLVIAGCLLNGVVGLVTRWFPKPVSVLSIAASLSLLGFNDQYTPWMGSVFGAIITAYGCVVMSGTKRTNTPALFNGHE